MTKLREHMIQDLMQAGRAESTRRQYVNCIREYARQFNRCPSELGPEEIREWVQHVRNSILRPDRIRQHLAALKFLYAKTLGRSEVVAFLTFPSTPRKLASVLSVEEVERVLGALKLVKYRVLFTTMYAAGLRITEVCHLKTSDIDAQRGVIQVRYAKGKKERLVMLPARLLKILRAYWAQERPPKPWLFVSTRDASKPIVVSTTRKAFEHATLVAGLTKKATPHALRHYADYAELRIIATASLRICWRMGRTCASSMCCSVTTTCLPLSSTTRYVGVSTKTIAKTKSPIDALSKIG